VIARPMRTLEASTFTDDPKSLCWRRAIRVHPAGAPQVAEVRMMRKRNGKCARNRARFHLLSCLLVLWGTSRVVRQVDAAPVSPRDPPFSSDRIDRLPPEVRREVLSKCKSEPQAGHYFATYDDRSNLLRLDYSLLECGSSPTTCSSSGCLQETFIKHHGRFVLQRIGK
jgi:hypothetical protein